VHATQWRGLEGADLQAEAIEMRAITP